MRRILFLLLLSPLSLTYVEGAPRPENLASGKQYTFKPAPDYHLCTDPQDKVQLTDGVYTNGYFWTQMTTVGWRYAIPIEITIDLQTPQPISGLSLNSAAGIAGVQWPASIRILVGKDGKTFYSVGDLVQLSAAEHGQPPTGKYAIHRYETSKLQTCGRYVKLLVFGSGAYFFVDEIEVYKGTPAFLTSPPPSEPIDDAAEFARQVMTNQGLRRRLLLDLAEVRRLAGECDRISTCANELASIEKEISSLDFKAGPDFRTVFPIHPLHNRIFEMQASLWRSRGLSDLVLWQKNRWDMLSPTEVPQAGNVAVDVAMMQNEHRGAAFNISNAGPDTQRIELTIEALRPHINPDCITVYEVPFTDTRSGVPIAAAMPRARRQNDKYLLDVQPGMTRQIWLDFFPHDVPPSRYRATIAVTPGNHRIPLTLKVYPFRFGDQPTLHLGGWDYTDTDNSRQVTPHNVTAFVEHLREHFVDTPWATSRVLPSGKYDRRGNMIEQPDTRDFLYWIKRWPNARNYYVFMSFGQSFAGHSIGTPSFENAVANWIKWWAAKLPQFNVRPNQLGLLLVDEPHDHELDDRIIAYARIIRRTAPEIVIWEDPTWRQPQNARPQLFELSDVLCPNLPMLIAEGDKFADFYTKQQQAGRRLSFYSCSGPGKLLDPYSYHRLQHWFCWKYGAEGSAFWAFGDSNGASSWNEYLTLRGAYTPLFLDDNSVTAGKHMEAIREGMEDYEYLVMLKAAIAEHKARGGSDDIIKQAQGLLARAADDVTGDQTPEKLLWSQPKDRSVADRVRIEILEMMTKLDHLAQ